MGGTSPDASGPRIVHLLGASDSLIDAALADTVEAAIDQQARTPVRWHRAESTRGLDAESLGLLEDGAAVVLTGSAPVSPDLFQRIRGPIAVFAPGTDAPALKRPARARGYADPLAIADRLVELPSREQKGASRVLVEQDDRLAAVTAGLRDHGAEVEPLPLTEAAVDSLDAGYDAFRQADLVITVGAGAAALAFGIGTPVLRLIDGADPRSFLGDRTRTRWAFEPDDSERMLVKAADALDRPWVYRVEIQRRQDAREDAVRASIASLIAAL